ncbi:MAG TPA: DUF4870 domain-containing protein [Clostridiaceae bacterium]|nr:DUF4870 domain-containing protein [Clostridiaceae bacterium]
MSSGNSNKTSLGISENVAGLLCYVLTWITGIIFYILEKENRFVKFHAIQSIVTFLPLMVFSYIIGIIPFLGPLIKSIIWILEVILWLILMIKAYRGEMYKLPITGDFAEQQLDK